MAEVLRDPSDGWCVAAPVVVEDDHHLGFELTDVVERLVRHASGQRPITHHADDLACLAGELPRSGESERIAQTGRGVRILDQIVLRLAPRGIAAEAALLAQGVELIATAGEDLVDVRLMSGVE